MVSWFRNPGTLLFSFPSLSTRKGVGAFNPVKKYSTAFLCCWLALLTPVQSLASLSNGMSKGEVSGDITKISQDDEPKIAIIGAGAAGLAAARVLSREGYHQLTILEAQEEGGGVWKYRPHQEPSSKSNTHPMYQGLRTNLPKELMAFREFSFAASKRASTDASFVPHTIVQDYLMDYKDNFGLDSFIQYNSSVHDLKVLPDEPSRLSPKHIDEVWPRVQLKWSTMNGKEEASIFDAVIVCNGHYAKASIPPVPGLNEFYQGKIVHSITYDNPADFEGKTVLCVGGRASGADVAREVAQYAKHVYLSDTSCKDVWEDGAVTLVPKTIEVLPSGNINFAHDCPIQPHVDVIVFCSGYDYSFPFIKDDNETGSDSKGENLGLSVEPGARTVTPLYEQLWHVNHPSVSFIGLPHSVVPFPLFEFQAEAICAQWTSSTELPPLEERMKQAMIDASIGGPKKTGRPQDTHYLGDEQWSYCRRMMELSGSVRNTNGSAEGETLEDYLRANEAIYNHAGKARKSGTPGGPDSYREIRYERPSWGKWKVLSPKDGDSDNDLGLSAAQQEGDSNTITLQR